MKNIINVESVFLLSKGEIVKYYLISYWCIFFLSLLFYKSLFLSLICGFVCLRGLSYYKTHIFERKKTIVLKEFNEVLYSMSTSFEMGRSLVFALEQAERTLLTIYKDKSLLANEIMKTRLEIVNGNQREEIALSSLSQRVPLEDIRDFVDVYIFCKKTGGNVGKVISSSSQIITEKITIEREIIALMSQKKFEGQIIIGMPIVTILFLNIFSPDYLELLYTTIQGRLIMTASLLGIIVSFIYMNKLTHVEI